MVLSTGNFVGTAKAELQAQVETLYTDHHNWLFGWLRRRLGDSFLAADLAQDTFINVITGGSSNAIREPRPFLATIARGLVANHHRRQLLENSYLELLSTLPEELAPSPEVQLLAIEALRQIDQALDGLPVKIKEAFLLAHLEELSYAEIAQRLGVSLSSVKQYLTRANSQCLFSISV